MFIYWTSTTNPLLQIQPLTLIHVRRWYWRHYRHGVHVSVAAFHRNGRRAVRRGVRQVAGYRGGPALAVRADPHAGVGTTAASVARQQAESVVTGEETTGAGGKRATIQAVPREGGQRLLVGEATAVGELTPGLEWIIRSYWSKTNYTSLAIFIKRK